MHTNKHLGLGALNLTLPLQAIIFNSDGGRIQFCSCLLHFGLDIIIISLPCDGPGLLDLNTGALLPVLSFPPLKT